MTDKVALITGANRGIGWATALKLAQQGYRIALVGRKLSELQMAKTHLQLARSGNHQYFVCDLSQTQEFPILLDQVLKHFGRLDVIINNAGLLVEEDIAKADLGAWDQALDINLRAGMHLIHHALPHLKRTAGSIVNIGSTAGFRTYRGGANYCATKYGLRGFSGALFEDVRNDGIKVCLIEPGFVNTQMHDAVKENLETERMIQPEDVAEAISYVLATPTRICPTEITLMPQVDPRPTRR